jgi:superfamily II RNA helicase
MSASVSILRLKALQRSHCPLPVNPSLSTRRLQLLAIVYKWQRLLRSWHRCEQRMQLYKNSWQGKKRNSLEPVGLLEV